MTPETPILAQETPILAPKTPILALETPILTPETPILTPETPILAQETQMGGGRTYGRTDGRTEILPCVLQDFVPFGSAAQKGDPNQPPRPRLIPETTTLALVTPILAPETPINPGDPN